MTGTQSLFVTFCLIVISNELLKLSTQNFMWGHKHTYNLSETFFMC